MRSRQFCQVEQVVPDEAVAFGRIQPACVGAAVVHFYPQHVERRLGNAGRRRLMTASCVSGPTRVRRAKSKSVCCTQRRPPPSRGRQLEWGQRPVRRPARARCRARDGRPGPEPAGTPTGVPPGASHRARRSVRPRARAPAGPLPGVPAGRRGPLRPSRRPAECKATTGSTVPSPPAGWLPLPRRPPPASLTGSCIPCSTRWTDLLDQVVGLAQAPPVHLVPPRGVGDVSLWGLVDGHPRILPEPGRGRVTQRATPRPARTACCDPTPRSRRADPPPAP